MLDNEIVSGTVRDSLNFDPSLNEDTEMTGGVVDSNFDGLLELDGNAVADITARQSMGCSLDVSLKQSQLRKEQEMARSVLRNFTDLTYRLKDAKSLQVMRCKLETLQIEMRNLANREKGSILSDARNRHGVVKMERIGDIGVKRVKIAGALAKKLKTNAVSWNNVASNGETEHSKLTRLVGDFDDDDDDDDDEEDDDGIDGVSDGLKTEAQSEELDNEYWLRKLSLTIEDRHVLVSVQQLNDVHIDAASTLLRKQFPHVGGLESSLLSHSPSLLGVGGYSRQINNKLNSIQMHYISPSHWITSTRQAGCVEVFVYDSLRPHCSKANIAPDIMLQLRQIYASGDDPLFVTCPPITRQDNSCDCGVFAIATATDVCFGLNPSLKCYDIKQMRKHLENCYILGNMQPFPVVTLF